MQAATEPEGDYRKNVAYFAEVREKVRRILQNHEPARDSDRAMLLEYLRQNHNAWVEYGVVKIKVEDWMKVDFLTIFRRRQEIQREGHCIPSSQAIRNKRGKEDLGRSLEFWERLE